MEAYESKFSLFEGFHIEEIIKREEIMRIYKLSWVILEMGVFFTWSLLLSHLDCFRGETVEVKPEDAGDASKLQIHFSTGLLNYTMKRTVLHPLDTCQHNRMVRNYMKSSACCHYCPGYMDTGPVTELFCKGIHTTSSWETTHRTCPWNTQGLTVSSYITRVVTTHIKDILSNVIIQGQWRGG